MDDSWRSWASLVRERVVHSGRVNIQRGVSLPPPLPCADAAAAQGGPSLPPIFADPM